MTEAQALWVSLVLTLALAAFHWLAPRLRRLPGIPERVMTSFSGGLAVSFVFLHMLPGLLESKDTSGEFLAAQVTMTPLRDLGVYCLALLGLTTFMGLEYWARSGVRDGTAASQKAQGPGAEDGTEDRAQQGWKESQPRLQSCEVLQCFHVLLLEERRNFGRSHCAR